jgi:thioredoxin-related protein
MAYYNLPGYATSDDYRKAAEYYAKHRDKDRAIDMMERALEAKQNEYVAEELRRQFQKDSEFWDW